MRFIQLVAAVLASSLVACSKTPPPPPPVPEYTAETFYQSTTYFGTSVSADNRFILMGSDATGIYNVYKQPIDGGNPIQLTFSDDDAYYPVRWFPNDNRFLFTADQGGNELNHTYVANEDGLNIDLTPGDKLTSYPLGFSEDGQYLFISTNERDNRFFDLYRYDTRTYERERVFQNDQGYQVQEVSPDGRLIALSKAINNVRSELFVFDLSRPQAGLRQISQANAKATFDAASFTPDSQHLVYTTNLHGEFAEAWIVDLNTNSHAPFIQDQWDVTSVAYSPSGRYRVNAVNADAKTVINVVDTASNKEVLMPMLPDGDITRISFSPDDSYVVFYLNSDTSPSNLFSLRLADKKLTRLTDALNPNIDQDVLVAGQPVRFSAFDGIEIPGILYKPKQASAANPVPALVWVHGGPGGQSRHGYSPTVQHLVNQGYAIFYVNNRGSSGYGKTFFHLDDKNHGENDLMDIIYGKRYLQTLDWVAEDRIGVIGGSYGGFMTAAALAFHPDEFEVGINIFGVTNWLRTLESIPPWWESFREALYDEMGDPSTDRERLTRISPLFHAKNIKKPLLVVQGANDPRVLQVESDELVEAVRANGVPVEYVLFDDEGHGFSKKANRITASRAFVDFLDKHL